MNALFRSSMIAAVVMVGSAQLYGMEKGVTYPGSGSSFSELVSPSSSSSSAQNTPESSPGASPKQSPRLESMSSPGIGCFFMDESYEAWLNTEDGQKQIQAMLQRMKEAAEAKKASAGDEQKNGSQ